MKKICCFLLIVLPFTLWGKNLQVIDVNLDLAPEHRWDAAYNVFKSNIRPLADYYREEVTSLLGDSATVEKIKKAIWANAYLGLIFTPELYREIKGIAAHATEMSFEEWLLFNIGYEFTTRCTAIACSHIPSTKPYMLRNLDWNSPSLGNLAFIARFTRNGFEVARAPTFFGMVGLLTGVAPGRAAIALNYRKTENGIMGYNYLAVLMGAWSSSFLVRKALLDSDGTAPHYEQIINNYLMGKTLIAPCYFTVVGTKPGEGAVIMRDRLSGKIYSTANSQSGVIAQTNIDPSVNEVTKEWTESDILLENAIERRDLAYAKSLEAIQKGHLPGADILEYPPIHNEQTLFHAILSPSERDEASCQAWN